MNVRDVNRRAWDHQVAADNQWTRPVSSERVGRAREGDWSVVLTPSRPVPADWFGTLSGQRVLGLACGGGQQCPLFAAAGADVTVLDNSPAQLDRDRQVAAREGLTMDFVEGDMADLSAFEDASFDLVFHPCSNAFAPDVRPIWREAYRVLRPGGALLSGFTNPAYYLFDIDALERGELDVAYRVPYSDVDDMPAAQRDRRIARGEPLEFGHSLEDQLGGQLAAGFVLTALFEDNWPDEQADALSRRMPLFIATRAVKPG